MGTAPKAKDPSGAERQRRWRQRDKVGVRVCWVDVDEHIVDQLVAREYLAERDMEDVHAIGKAITAFLKRKMEPR